MKLNNSIPGLGLCWTQVALVNQLRQTKPFCGLFRCKVAHGHQVDCLRCKTGLWMNCYCQDHMQLAIDTLVLLR